MQAQLATLPQYANLDRKPRLESLYSDFTDQRESNPAAFESNIQWWYDILKMGLEHYWFDDGNRLILNARKELVERFYWESVGNPLALSTVIVSVYSPFIVSTSSCPLWPSKVRVDTHKTPNPLSGLYVL